MSGSVTKFPMDMHPMGQMSYFNLTGFTVTIGSQSNGSNNFVAVTPGSGTVASTLNRHFDCPVEGRLRYKGSDTRLFHIAATFSFRAATAGDIFVVSIAKNGTVLEDSKALATLTATVDHGASIHAYTSMSNGDYLEFYVANTSAGRNMTAKTLQIFAMGMK